MRRSSPPKRRTYLKRSSKPIKVTSRTRRSLQPWMTSCRSATVERAKGRCEGECGGVGTEWHHVFGRTLGVRGAAKWAHIPELTVMLCYQCHQVRWPLDHYFRGVLRRFAVSALVRRYAPGTLMLADETAETWDEAAPLAVREIVTALVKDGVEPSCSG